MKEDSKKYEPIYLTTRMPLLWVIGSFVVKVTAIMSFFSLAGVRLSILLVGSNGRFAGWILGAVAGAIFGPFVKFSSGWEPRYAYRVLTTDPEAEYPSAHVKKLRVKGGRFLRLFHQAMSYKEWLARLGEMRFSEKLVVAVVSGLWFGGWGGLLWLAAAESPWSRGFLLEPRVASIGMTFGPFAGAILGSMAMALVLSGKNRLQFAVSRIRQLRHKRD